ncbi:MAG: hypothetical protein FWF44_11160 [Defluviitaleaceae bacterium]|nr:hypothetical protein [Defluviitaleaceae bacterium]
MNRKIYRETAKKFSVSVKEVKRGMQEAVDETYTACPEKKPTVDAFIHQIARRAIEERDKKST